METVKTTPTAGAKEPQKEAVKAPKETAKKYLVIKNFTADKPYYTGNTFVSSDKTLVGQLLNSKLIK